MDGTAASGACASRAPKRVLSLDPGAPGTDGCLRAIRGIQRVVVQSSNADEVIADEQASLAITRVEGCRTSAPRLPGNRRFRRSRSGQEDTSCEPLIQNARR